MKNRTLIAYIALNCSFFFGMYSANVTQHQYSWNGSNNLSIAIQPEHKTNFSVTFEANPTQDLDIGLYSAAYKRKAHAYSTISAERVEAYPGTNRHPLSAIVELAYGGWGNTQSAITIEGAEGRSSFAKQTILNDLAIPSRDVGVMQTYNFSVTLTETTFSASLAVQDPDTKQFKTLMSLTQDDLPPAEAESESVFDALKKILTTGFTEIGFVGYGPGYTVQNWSFESAGKPVLPEVSPVISEPINQEKIVLPEVSPVISEPTNTPPLIQNVITSAYAWEDANATNATIPIPRELQKNFRITFKANPQNDLHIGFYSETYQRNTDAYNFIAAKEIPPVSNKSVTPLSAVIECVFGGWSNTASMIRFEYTQNRSLALKEVGHPVIIPADNVGVFKTYRITGKLTASTLDISIGYYTNAEREETFIEMAKITQENLPPLGTNQNEESMFMALQKPTCTGLSKIGFLGYGTTYEIHDWQVSALETQTEAARLAAEKAAQEKAIADTAAAQAETDKIAADKAEAERVAAEKATAETEVARLAAEKAAQEKAIADAAAAQAETDKIAADKAEAERVAAEKATTETEAARLAAEKAAQEKAAADAGTTTPPTTPTSTTNPSAEPSKPATDPVTPTITPTTIPITPSILPVTPTQPTPPTTPTPTTNPSAEPSKPTTGSTTKSVTTQNTTIQSLSARDTKRQETVTTKYTSVQTNLTNALTQAQEAQRTATTVLASAQKLTASTSNTKLKKNAARIKAALDGYIPKITKAQTTLAATKPPFNTSQAITRAQRNIDNLEKYSTTALALIKQRMEETSTLQQTINAALGTVTRAAQ